MSIPSIRGIRHNPTNGTDVAGDRGRLLQTMVDFAIAAGGAVADYGQGKCSVERKADSSPVTAADFTAEAIIIAGLAHAAPGIPVVAEEEVGEGRIPVSAARFFLVDALDGTKEFISGGTDYTVNIGLVEDGVPTLGVVYAPARATVYWGDVVLGKAWQATHPPHGAGRPAVRITVGKPKSALCAVASKSHNTPETEAWLRASSIKHRVSIGSSLKFVLIAAGEADVYPRPAPTMEWDTAAGDAVLRAAGGRVLDLDGRPLVYGKPSYFNPGFLATGLYEPAPLRPFMRAAAPAKHFE
jgi:3'(2'), 5'-bisphosphate nucleotidase